MQTADRGTQQTGRPAISGPGGARAAVPPPARPPRSSAAAPAPRRTTPSPPGSEAPEPPDAVLVETEPDLERRRDARVHPEHLIDALGGPQRDQGPGGGGGG